MADSLRDQLIAAGYDAPKKEQKRKPRPQDNAKGKKKPARKGKKTATRHNPGQAPGQKQGQKQGQKPGQKPGQPRGNRHADGQSAEALAAIEERKKLKAQIKELIDANKIENWKGEVVYRYLVDKKIRELYVTEDLHKQLADRSVAITRLNGDTYLVPLGTANEIKGINPQWSVFNTDAADEAVAPDAGESDYADFQIPDDLKW